MKPDTDILAALEFHRRWRKGLPSDRWTDGHKGAVEVARGIEAMAVIIAAYMAEDQRRGTESMSIGDPKP